MLMPGQKQDPPHMAAARRNTNPGRSGGFPRVCAGLLQLLYFMTLWRTAGWFECGNPHALAAFQPRAGGAGQ